MCPAQFCLDSVRKHNIQVISANKMYHMNVMLKKICQYFRIQTQLFVHQFETNFSWVSIESIQIRKNRKRTKDKTAKLGFNKPSISEIGIPLVIQVPRLGKEQFPMSRDIL